MWFNFRTVFPFIVFSPAYLWLYLVLDILTLGLIVPLPLHYCVLLMYFTLEFLRQSFHPGCLGTCCIEWTSFKLTKILCLPGRMLRLKVGTTIPSASFKNFKHGVILISFLSLFFTPYSPMPRTPSQIHGLFLNHCCYKYIYTCPFSADGMCLGLTSWDWVTMEGRGLSQEKTDASFLSSH